MTMLERAKKMASEGDPKYALSKDSLELAELMIAWVMGEVDNHQVAKICGVAAHNSVPTKVGPALRELAKFGRIQIKILPEGKK